MTDNDTPAERHIVVPVPAAGPRPFAVVVTSTFNPAAPFALQHWAENREAIWAELRTGYKFECKNEKGETVAILDLEGTLVRVQDWGSTHAAAASGLVTRVRPGDVPR